MTQDAFRTPTPGTKSRQVFDLIVEGVDKYEAGRRVGVEPQTAERIVEKYINYNLLVLARERIAELEAELRQLRTKA